MNKIIAIILLGTMLLIPNSTVNQEFPKLVLKSPFLRVMIQIPQLKTASTICTAFVISPQLAITAAHCLGSPPEAYILADQRKSHFQAFTPIRVNQSRDIAILQGDFSHYESLKLSNLSGVEELGHTFTACGFPFGGHLVCTQVKTIGNYQHKIKLTGVILAGMSGGPVYDQESKMVFFMNDAVSDGFLIASPLINILSDLYLAPEE